MGVQHKTEFSSAIIGVTRKWWEVEPCEKELITVVVEGGWFKSVLSPPLSVLSSPPLLLFFHLILFFSISLSSPAFLSLHGHHDVSSSGHHTQTRKHTADQRIRNFETTSKA